MASVGQVQISRFHVAVDVQLLQQAFYNRLLNSDVKLISLTLIKPYLSGQEAFLHQLLKGKPSHLEYFIKVMYVGNM